MTAERRYRVLIVDDEDSVLRFVERALSEAGYQTATARYGQEAIDVAAREAAFDLLLTDLMMPGINGDELARHLRRADPDLNVLYLTGHSDQLFRNKRVLWDREAFLDKPVTIAALQQAVSLLLFGHTHGLKKPSMSE